MCVIRECSWSMIMVEVVMYLPSANEIISTNQQQTKVIQEVVSTAVSKLMYCTRKRDQMLFSPGKKLDRKKKTDSSQSLSTHHTSWWVVLYNEVIDSLILQEIFSSVWKCLLCNGEKTDLWDKNYRKLIASAASSSYIICMLKLCLMIRLIQNQNE